MFMLENMFWDLWVGILRLIFIYEENFLIFGVLILMVLFIVIGGKKFKVVFSKFIKYDVDYCKKFYWFEIVEFYYDCFYNLDNCYYICVDWMNVIVKFIEDVVENWVREVV